MSNRTLTIGVSLKLYLDVPATLNWVKRAVEVSNDSRPVRDGRIRLFVLPSFPAVPVVLDRVRGSALAVGAQDLHTEDRGAFTGGVSGADLAALGCRYVEVGHAERRRLFGEDEKIVAEKMLAASRNGLIPVLCVGEADRVSAAVAGEECVRQVKSGLSLCDARLTRLVVAYEPHWAIGAQEPAPVEHIASVCRELRMCLAADAHEAAVIYGGSAKAGLLRQLANDVDGLFLGRFAHDPETLRSILAEAEHILDAA